MDMQELRARIDAIDDEIAALSVRSDAHGSRDIVEAKRAGGIGDFRPRAERAILQRIHPGPMTPSMRPTLS
jgi:chorismate mutase